MENRKMKLKLFVKRLFAMLFSLLLVGCAGRQDMEISKTVFDKPSSIVIAQVTGLEDVGFYKEGHQGLVEFLFNEAMASSVAESIKKINTAEILEQHYFKPFEIAFLDKSFKVIKASEKLKKDSLVKYDGNDERCAPYSFKELKDKHNTELALVLEPKLFGAIRKYFSFVPTGAPRGYANLVVYLVRLEDNVVLGHYNAEVRIETKGDWDTPPDYTELNKASKTALATALNNAYLHFFVK